MGKQTSNIWLTVAVILGGIVLITAGIMRSDWNYYQTIEQVNASRPSGTTIIRIVGEIAPDSWQAGPNVGHFSFTLTDGVHKLPVQYTGPAINPGSGRQIVVEGVLGSDGVFQAGKILTKCESKYTIKTEKARGG